RLRREVRRLLVGRRAVPALWQAEVQQADVPNGEYLVARELGGVREGGVLELVVQGLRLDDDSTGVLQDEVAAGHVALVGLEEAADLVEELVKRLLAWLRSRPLGVLRHLDEVPGGAVVLEEALEV